MKKEAKIITHLSTQEVGEDVHIVKEVWKDDKDKYHDNIKIIKNLKRPFWVTKPIYRNHKEKKEAEDLNKLDMFTTEQSSDFMERNIAPRLGDRYAGKTNLRTIKASPYIYGLDVDSRVFLKRMYNKKYDTYTTSFRYGAFDIEVDTKTDTIIVISLCTNKVLLTYINKYYVRHVKNPYSKIMATYEKYIPDVPTKHNVKLDIKFFDSEIELIRKIFSKANEIEIDILGAWNIKYDISKIIERCEKYQVEPKEIFHYNKIPKQYAFFKFKPGRDKTARGAPINPEEQWPTIKSTTNYIMLDAMSTHRYVRVGGKTIPGGYSLANILTHEKIHSKLKFEDDNIDGVQGLEWHIWMVENHIIKYIVYNMWDVMSMIELDNKTKDMSKNLPLLSGVSPFEYFNSGPKKIVDAMTFFFLDRKKALGTKSPFQEEDESLGLKNWINNKSLIRKIPGTDRYVMISDSVHDLNKNKKILKNDDTVILNLDGEEVACKLNVLKFISENFITFNIKMLKNSRIRTSSTNKTFFSFDKPFIESEEIKGFYHIPYYSTVLINKQGDVLDLKSKKIKKFYTTKQRINDIKNTKQGYKITRLSSDDGKRSHTSRHRLMCLAFKSYKDSPYDLFVNHKNGIPGYDRLDNLEWVSPKENLIHALENGLMPNSVRKVYSYDIETSTTKMFKSITECSKALNINEGVVRRILNKKELRATDRYFFKAELDSPNEYKIKKTGEGITNKIVAIKDKESFIYKSIMEASRQTNVNTTSISIACRRGGGIAKGIFFKFKDFVPLLSN